MRKSIILVAGIFIACVLCAGIPAVSAAENQKVAASTPAPVIPQVTPAVTLPATTPDHPVNTTAPEATEVADQKNWWENLWPLNAIVRDEQNRTAVPQGTANPAVTNPVTPQQGAADNQKDVTDKKDTTNQKDTTDKKVTATPAPQAPGNP